MRFWLFSLAMALCAPAWAFRNNAFYAGVGYFSQNSLNHVADKPSGDSGFLGATSYPLNLKYDWGVNFDWFLAAQLSYTLLPRSSADNSAKTTMMHISFPIGQNFADRMSSHWEWSVGPGVIRYTTQGSGGTTTLNNGTSTAVFALPGRSSTIQNITLNGGLAWNVGTSRLGLDLIMEGAMSDKRSENLMFSYDYRFGGGF